MNIDENILHTFGAEDKIYKAKEIVFEEGDHALYYFQIAKGRVKLNNYNEDGKEFIHNILGKNQSFGDPLIFLERPYPMNSICLESTEIIRLPKTNFIEMLKEHPELSLEMNACFSQQVYYKLIMMQSMASQNPIQRLKGLLDYLKSYDGNTCGDLYFEVGLTRQQIANLIGLRVETVIRALKKMEKEGSVQLKNRKILY